MDEKKYRKMRKQEEKWEEDEKQEEKWEKDDNDDNDERSKNKKETMRKQEEETEIGFSSSFNLFGRHWIKCILQDWMFYFLRNILICGFKK